jgi:hypothetical protein
MNNARIEDLDAKVLAAFLKCSAGELGPIVSNDPVRDPEPVDDGLVELDCGLLVDLDHRGCFRPLGGLVDGDVQVPVPSDNPREQPQDVQPHRGNNHEGGIICSVCVGV